MKTVDLTGIYTHPVPHWPLYDHSDVEAVRAFCDVLTDPQRIGDALFPANHTDVVASLCDTIRDYFSVSYAFCVNSGWSAGFAILAALDLRPGDKFIVPSYAHGQSISAFRLFGVEPVFVDPDRTLNLDPDRISTPLDPAIRGIWLTHVHGNPCDMERISEIASSHGLLLVEDCCQSWGAELEGRKVGTFGDFAYFSFCSPKQISSGNGGCVITRSEERFRRLVLASGRQGELFARCFGQPMEARERLRARGYYRPVSVGETRYFNDTLTYSLDIAPIEAAVTINKIAGVDERNAQIRRHVGLFKRLLEGEGIEFADEYPGARGVFMRLDLRIDFARLTIDRAGFIDLCKRAGIGAEIETPPEYLPAVRRIGGGDVTPRLGDWLSLAAYKWYSPAAERGVEQIARVMRTILRACRR